MPSNALRLHIQSEQGTIAIAKAFEGIVGKGDVILLEGDLGAGKSFFARALIRTLAQDDELDVPSPTFSLVQPYQFGDLQCLHADLYRLSDESEAEELGLFDDDLLLIIEWPDRLPEMRDRAHFAITLENVRGKPNERIMGIDASLDQLKKLVQALESHSDVIQL